MVMTYHELKSRLVEFRSKMHYNSHALRIYMLSNNVDIKKNNRNL